MRRRGTGQRVRDVALTSRLSSRTPLVLFWTNSFFARVAVKVGFPFGPGEPGQSRAPGWPARACGKIE